GSVRHTYAEVIPVRRVNDNFLRAGRARNLSDDVVRVVLLRHGGERGGGTNPQRTALISGLFSCGKFFCEVKSRSFKELPGCGERKPTFHGAGDLLGFEIQLGGIPAGLQDTERIAGGCVFVYHETSFGALPGSFLKFVSPAAIVGHGASFEKGGVVRSEARVVYHDHYNLILHVQALVVVPVIFRRDYAIAREDEFSVFQGCSRGDTAPGHILVVPLEFQGLVTCG